MVKLLSQLVMGLSSCEIPVWRDPLKVIRENLRNPAFPFEPAGPGSTAYSVHKELPISPQGRGFRLHGQTFS